MKAGDPPGGPKPLFRTAEMTRKILRGNIPITSDEKLVLLAIVDAADVYSGEYPISKLTLKQRTCVKSERTIDKCVRSLEKLDLIRIRRERLGKFKSETNVYKLNVDALSEAIETSTLHPLPPALDSGAPPIERAPRMPIASTPHAVQGTPQGMPREHPAPDAPKEELFSEELEKNERTVLPTQATDTLESFVGASREIATLELSSSCGATGPASPDSRADVHDTLLEDAWKIVNDVAASHGRGPYARSEKNTNEVTRLVEKSRDFADARYDPLSILRLQITGYHERSDAKLVEYKYPLKLADQEGGPLGPEPRPLMRSQAPRPTQTITTRKIDPGY